MENRGKYIFANDNSEYALTQLNKRNAVQSQNATPSYFIANIEIAELHLIYQNFYQARLIGTATQLLIVAEATDARN